ETVVVVETSETDSPLLDKRYPREVADLLVRSLLLGRRQFEAPLEPNAARYALGGFFSWVPSILRRIEEGCRNTTIGTKFEDQVRTRALKLLGISPDVEKKELFGKLLVTG